MQKQIDLVDQKLPRRGARLSFSSAFLAALCASLRRTIVRAIGVAGVLTPGHLRGGLSGLLRASFAQLRVTYQAGVILVEGVVTFIGVGILPAPVVKARDAHVLVFGAVPAVGLSSGAVLRGEADITVEAVCGEFRVRCHT